MKEKSDPKKLLAELQYYINYYGNEFKAGQGLENIIDIIQMYTKSGTWLDLGGGSNTPFWKMFFPKLDKIVCMDINREAFLLSELIMNEFVESPCYKEGRKMLRKPKYNDNVKIEYECSDLLSQEIVFKEQFDNITQFGLLGLLVRAEDFLVKTREILNGLKNNGIYIGVNWIFSETYQKKMGFSNSYINKNLLLDCEVVGEIEQIYYREVQIHGDPNYDKCIIYVMKKRV